MEPIKPTQIVPPRIARSPEVCAPSPAAVAVPLKMPQPRGLLHELLAISIIRPDAWERLEQEVRSRLIEIKDASLLLQELTQHQILSEYQAARVGMGCLSELVIGNYRILDHLGSGGMAVVLKAEHMYLRRIVAIKILRHSGDYGPEMLQRFTNEMWTIAQCQHPNIVAAVDAGQFPSPEAESGVCHYLAMEYVPGEDLDGLVRKQGPLDPATTAEIAYQISQALAEANRHNLVHRDIKPSNIRLTPEGQAKLLDFGLVRHLGQRLTEHGTVMGTLHFIAPEQLKNSSHVDIRADIYGLGGTLFWCLTGKLPFHSQGLTLQQLIKRRLDPPPPVRSFRPEIPAELETVVATMLAPDPVDRYSRPENVMQALLPFLKPSTREAHFLAQPRVEPHMPPGAATGSDSGKVEVLLVDDDPLQRRLCRMLLPTDQFHCTEACDGESALQAFHAARYDLVLLDVDMPRLNGFQVLERLRLAPSCPHLKVIMLSGHHPGDELARMLAAGADDFLTKPFSQVQLFSRVQAAVRLKRAQDRSEKLTHHLLAVNHELEHTLHARDSDLVHARNALVLALAELVAHRDPDTGKHLLRMQNYVRCLAEAASGHACLAGQIDRPFIEMLECCAPLHDIGKAGLPDHILLKAGPLSPEEHRIMEAHTIIGAETLRKVAQRHGFARAFLHMAMEITRHHHERFDGTGYPDNLRGEDIPLAARIVTLCDVYDALRSRRIYKPALTHRASLAAMSENEPGRQFDPVLFAVFHDCGDQFEGIYRSLAE